MANAKEGSTKGAVGSCIQIALFVEPLLLLLSYAVAPHPLLLLFPRLLVVITFISSCTP